MPPAARAPAQRAGRDAARRPSARSPPPLAGEAAAAAAWSRGPRACTAAAAAAAAAVAGASAPRAASLPPSRAPRWTHPAPGWGSPSSLVPPLHAAAPRRPAARRAPGPTRVRGGRRRLPGVEWMEIAGRGALAVDASRLSLAGCRARGGGV